MECIAAVCQCVETPAPTSKAPSPNPTPASSDAPSEAIVLTASPTTAPACGCVDFVPPGEEFWYDSDGTFYNCEWYSGESSRCSNYGSGYENFNKVANEACCACGGGVDNCGGTEPSPAPQTDAPSPAPQTDAPSPAPQTNTPTPAPQAPPPPPPPPPPGPVTSSPVATPACTNVVISIATDQWPQETTWILENSSGGLVKEDGPYSLETTYTTELCLFGDTYTFTIDDTYGDGILGEGYSISVAGNVIATGSSFGYQAVESFTIEGPPPPPTAAPVLSPTTSCQCSDYNPGNGEEWYDRDGPFYNCAWYSQGTSCSDYGDSYANFGQTANTACCACGGGSC